MSQALSSGASSDGKNIVAVQDHEVKAELLYQRFLILMC